MASEMVERVARAMRRNGRPAFDDTVPLSDIELADARAAIKAMRVPTEEMLKAGAGEPVPDPSDLTGFYWPNDEDALRPAWRAMIDAALS